MNEMSPNMKHDNQDRELMRQLTLSHLRTVLKAGADGKDAAIGAVQAVREFVGEMSSKDGTDPDREQRELQELADMLEPVSSGPTYVYQLFGDDVEPFLISVHPVQAHALDFIRRRFRMVDDGASKMSEEEFERYWAGIVDGTNPDIHLYHTTA